MMLKNMQSSKNMYNINGDISYEEEYVKS